MAARLPDNRARITADKGIAAQMFAALDRFEEERLRLAANFAIGRKGCFNVGDQPACDRDEVALCGQLQEFRKSGGVHGETSNFKLQTSGKFQTSNLRSDNG